jgi:hypothetical protein
MQERPSASTSLMAWGIVSGYPAMLHGFKVQAGPIHVRILRPLVLQGKPIREFHAVRA